MKILEDQQEPGQDIGTSEYNSSTHQGKLILKAIEAKLLINTEMFGKMDPFLEVEFMGQVKKTPTHKDGGKLPVWNFTLPEILIPKDVPQEQQLVKV